MALHIEYPNLLSLLCEMICSPKIFPRSLCNLVESLPPRDIGSIQKGGHIHSGTPSLAKKGTTQAEEGDLHTNCEKVGAYAPCAPSSYAPAHTPSSPYFMATPLVGTDNSVAGVTDISYGKGNSIGPQAFDVLKGPPEAFNRQVFV